MRSLERALDQRLFMVLCEAGARSAPAPVRFFSKRMGLAFWDRIRYRHIMRMVRMAGQWPAPFLFDTHALLW